MTPSRTIAGVIVSERDYIRRELDIFFSTYPTYRRRGGQLAGLPGRGPAKDPTDRQRTDWSRVDAARYQPAPAEVFFTETGLAALRTMMADGRLADSEKFAHMQELGIAAAAGACAE